LYGPDRVDEKVRAEQQLVVGRDNEVAVFVVGDFPLLAATVYYKVTG
jgi:hypothetical protein